MPDPHGDLEPGDVVWVEPGPAIGHTQGGWRPALVIAGGDYLAVVGTLAIVVPMTTVDRGWPNHIAVVGADLPVPSWAMSEQVRTISGDRILARAGAADRTTLQAVRDWVADFLDL